MSRARDLADGTFSGAFSADSPTLVVDDTNNRVGIGTASPNTALTIIDNNTYQLRLATTDDAYSSAGIYLGEDVSDPGYYGTIKWDQSATSMRVSMRDGSNTGGLIFETGNSGSAPVERARFDTSGNLLHQTTTTSNLGTTYRGIVLRSDGGTGAYLQIADTGTGGKTLVYFYNGNGVVGSINTSGSSTSYSTSSDYRLKENVTELTGAIDRIKQVPVHRFNFISDPDRTVDGFLAHEVADVVPEAISGEKDAMKTEEYEVTPAVLDDDGNVVTEAVMGTREVIDPQGIDQSKLVPLLTAAIKEQQALIEDLQTRLAALEAV